MRRAFLGCAILLLLIAACAPPSSVGNDAPAKTTGGVCHGQEVTIGMLPPGLSNAGIYIADQRGYFKNEGINLNVKQFRSGDDQTASLARGDLQIATGGPNAGLYNAVARGIRAKIVADKGYGSPKFDWAQFLTTPKLKAAGLASMADVKGHSIGVVGQGATQEVALAKTLELNGLTMKDVSVTVIPFPQMRAALASGSIDVIFQTEPELTRMLKAGDAVSIGTPTKAYPEQQTSVIFYSEQFIADHSDAGDCFMRAYLRGVRDYNDAFVRGKGVADVRAALVKAGVVDDPAVLDDVNVVGLNPDGHVITESIQTDIDFYQEHGYLEQKTTAADIVDNSFAGRAVKALGQY